MCALTLKSNKIEMFSTSLSSPSDKPLHVCMNLLEKHKVGYFNKVKIEARVFGKAKEWIMEQGKDIQLVLIGMKGIKIKLGHCICAMNGQIVYKLYKTSLPLEKDNLVYALVEDVNELYFSYIFIQIENLCLK